MCKREKVRLCVSVCSAWKVCLNSHVLFSDVLPGPVKKSLILSYWPPPLCSQRPWRDCDGQLAQVLRV